MKVSIIAAITADGFIAKDVTQVSTDWTSDEDKAMFRQFTKDAGTMIVGSSTFATINRGMPGRTIYVHTTHPEKIGGIDGVVATAASPADLLRELEQKGCQQVAICGGASIYRQYLEAGLVDEMYLTVEPILFGSGISLFDAALQKKLALKEVKQLNNNTLQLIYSVR